MKKDIRQWCQECHACQASKLHRHTRAPLQERTLPTTRFQSIHIDLVGPLPVSQNNRYLLTIIDSRDGRKPFLYLILKGLPALWSSYNTGLHVSVCQKTSPATEEGSLLHQCGQNFSSCLASKFIKLLPIIHKQTGWWSDFTISLKRH